MLFVVVCSCAAAGLFLVLGKVEFLQRPELSYERLVLALQHGYPVLKTANVLLLLPPTLSGCLSAVEELT